MNLLKLYMYHEDVNSARNFLVYKQRQYYAGQGKFQCICKKCMGNITMGQSKRVGDRLQFLLRCDKCNTMERTEFNDRQLTANSLLMNKFYDERWDNDWF